ncbi:glycine betaine/L-proline ABC transporter substrate-binding protein ProX [Arcobacteraceae bacterium]|nr:glycine betaine/L-proline ABC transporter substrate-binding protein ProX [Arcobacteraceae bacterium]
MFKKKSLIGLAASVVLTSSLFGAKVTALKTTLQEEAFQLQIVAEILKKMGHTVEVSNDLKYTIAFQTIADNAKSDDVYFMAAHWDPIQTNMIKGVGKEKLAISSAYIANCASGYVIDKKTADKYNIKYISDLSDPKIAKLFDSSGNGKADLTGASVGWEVADTIEYHLDAFKLRDTIDHNQGTYSALLSDTMARYKTGKPVIFFTWTPYWLSGELIPGKDIVFLQVTKSANPSGVSTKLSNGSDYGFPVNSQKIVANQSVNTKHKDIAKLFDIVKLNVNDVSGQNLLMRKGQNKAKDIKKHTQIWLKRNAVKVDAWIKEAQAAK